MLSRNTIISQKSSRGDTQPALSRDASLASEIATPLSLNHEDAQGHAPIRWRLDVEDSLASRAAELRASLRLKGIFCIAVSESWSGSFADSFARGPPGKGSAGEREGEREAWAPPSLLAMLRADARAKAGEEVRARRASNEEDATAAAATAAAAAAAAVAVAAAAAAAQPMWSPANQHAAAAAAAAVSEGPAKSLSLGPGPAHFKSVGRLDAQTPRGVARRLVRTAVRRAAGRLADRATFCVLNSPTVANSSLGANHSTLNADANSSSASSHFVNSGGGETEAGVVSMSAAFFNSNSRGGGWESNGLALSLEQTAELVTLCTELLTLHRPKGGAFEDALTRYDPGAPAAVALLLQARLDGHIRRLPADARLTDDGALGLLRAAAAFDATARELAAGVACAPRLASLLESTGCSALFDRFVRAQGLNFDACVARALKQEDWKPALGTDKQRFSGSVVDVFTLLSQTARALTLAPQSMSGLWLSALLEAAVSAIFKYVSHLRHEVPDMSFVIPPPPPLEPPLRARSVAESRLVAARLEPSVEARLFSEPIEKTIVQLNNLAAMAVSFVPRLLEAVEADWRSLRALMAELDSAGARGLASASATETVEPDLYPTAVDWSRVRKLFLGVTRTLLYSCRDICDYIAFRIVFYDLRCCLVDGLYIPSVEQCSLRSSAALHHLAAARQMLLEEASSECAEQLMAALLAATVAVLTRILLDGGKYRIFAQSDAELLLEDVTLVEELFAMPDEDAESGGALPPELVVAQTLPLLEIIELYSRPSAQLVALYEDSAEDVDSESTKLSPETQREPSGEPREGSEKLLAIFAVLCHRADETALAFVSAQRARLAGLREDRLGGPGRQSSARELLRFGLSQMREKGGAALRGSGRLSADLGGTSSMAARR
mmetsp:Transcript_30524/g.76420  ORF Transcript_30524/g.76420 Transcript_30524/m.76420 type:complete len:897 (+) Transcript_30524:2647-5337(+)